MGPLHAYGVRRWRRVQILTAVTREGMSRSQGSDSAQDGPHHRVHELALVGHSVESWPRAKGHDPRSFPMHRVGGAAAISLIVLVGAVLTPQALDVSFKRRIRTAWEFKSSRGLGASPRPFEAAEGP